MDISADIRYPQVTDMDTVCYPLRVTGMGSGIVFRSGYGYPEAISADSLPVAIFSRV
jgi:hypothetical protein